MFVFLIGFRGARSRPIAGGACFGASGEYGFRNYFSHSFELFVSLTLTFLYYPPPCVQLVFEGDFSAVTTGAMIVGVVASGYGMMYFGMSHQQRKQGYWK